MLRQCRYFMKNWKTQALSHMQLVWKSLKQINFSIHRILSRLSVGQNLIFLHPNLLVYFPYRLTYIFHYLSAVNYSITRDCSPEYVGLS